MPLVIFSSVPHLLFRFLFLSDDAFDPVLSLLLSGIVVFAAVVSDVSIVSVFTCPSAADSSTDSSFIYILIIIANIRKKIK